MARLKQSSRQQSSAPDSNFRSGKGEWFRLLRPWRQRGPLPILIFVAAKENGPPAAIVAAAIFRVRFYSSLPQRKMVPPAVDVAATRSASDSILRCRNGEWFRLQNATTPPMHRFLISRPDLGITAAPSLLQRRTARLQRSRGVPAGTGCHEGGIILSKQPPEWRLSLPQQRSASDSNYRCCS